MKKLPQRALKQIRALCAGNGADRDSIQIRQVKGGMVTFDALTHLEVHPTFTDESKKGAYQIGEFFQDGAQMEHAIQAYLKGLMKNNDSRQLMTKRIKATPGQGFGSHAEYFPLKGLEKDYSFQQACGHCGGRAKQTCQTCQGQARVRCSKCNGQGLTFCSYCQGSGVTHQQDGQQEQCRNCYGRRQVPCGICQRTGMVTCKGCGGSGDQKCGHCDGAGIFTYIRHMAVQMKTLFELDRTQLDHPVTKEIEDKGGHVIDKGHIKLTQAEAVSREDGGLAIHYKAQFPYGDLALSINGKIIQTHLFGYRGKLLKLPNFLENLIEKNLDYLEDAATSPQKAANNLKRAMQVRLIAQAVMLTVQHPMKKAMIGLKKKYPLGISNDVIKQIIQLSRKALLNVTQKTRYGGYATGAIGCLLVSVLYIFLGVPALKLFIVPVMALAVVDLLMIIVGAFILYYVSDYMVKKPLMAALSPLLKGKNVAKIKMQSQSNMPVCAALSAGVYLVTLMAAHLSGMDVPAWFPLSEFF